ncbi:hypothetical protein BT63DRAFT_439772 [Microthyrium microscopicum]|uniref:F-box domain-containing protein n=1 Tax=Microthyrium microscopicum TaxID=703497 RepID=A0A6A6U9U5_9PEZI|nr:hypothetical protein BT63DRAFT_439772 [Microthyrium microscopicum]
MHSHINERFEACIPFAVYIRGGDQNASSLPSSLDLSRFMTLPFDIQESIIKSCDARTLWTLMQASSALRAEAQRAFWAHPDVWYYTSSEWLRLERGYSGSEPHCPEFASSVQQIEIEFTKLANTFQVSQQPTRGRIMRYALARTRENGRLHFKPIVEQVREFWENFNINFPAVQRVLISEHGDWRAPLDPLVAFSDLFKKLADACPQHVQIYASAREVEDEVTDEQLKAGYHNTKTNLYKYQRNDDSWVILQRNWTRDRVRLAFKKFSGLAGTIQQHMIKTRMLNQHFIGIRSIRMQT